MENCVVEANEEEDPLTAVGAWASSARVVLAVRGDFDSGVVEPDDTDPPKISTGALPSSSIRSSMKKAMAASRSATTMPTVVLTRFSGHIDVPPLRWSRSA